MPEVWTEENGVAQIIEAPATPVEPTTDEAPPCEDCGKPCRKAGRGYSRWCLEHSRDHRGDKAPKSRQPDSVKILADKRTAAVARTEKTVTQWLVMGQVGLIASGDIYCAKAIEEEGPPIARALAEVSQDFPMLRRAIETSDKWGALSVLAFHTGRLALIIGVHHNVVPYEGVVRFLVPAPFPTHEAVPSDNGHSATPVAN
jgi:hypothetical protein